ncbi:MAG TPA: hypothetical protein VHY48_05805 [Acidobacteriaceae bacterium]|jgi:hypothetical protein|nr:hypothetical protein [Acidobacteriaceae bacterium]
MIEVPLTDAQFAAAAQRLREHGVELSGPSGTLSKDGITARYQHADGKLTIEIVKKPVFLPVSVIESRLRSYIDQALAADASRSAG